MIQSSSDIYIDFIPEKGRAVFAARNFAKGDIIEVCPVIFIPQDEKETIHGTVLHDYYFDWGDEGADCCIALGFGSMYNHGEDSNADYVMYVEDRVLQIICQKPISGGEEICISYISNDSQRDRLWF